MTFIGNRRGYTIVELMITVLLVTVLAATVGTFIVKLLTLQETDREDAYIREKLVDICGAFADVLSVGSSVNPTGQGMIVKYQQETGGVSLETGVVSHVTVLTQLLNVVNKTLDLNVYGLELGSNVLKLARKLDGTASLIPLKEIPDIVNCDVQSLNGENAALVRLQVSAQYENKNVRGEFEMMTTRVERIVRLWNHR